ncbi:hypothetical protein SISSUDRAFT_1057005 [Sistotremastrum suecicum HHB10207 ss-3]|uniref:Protein PNS1 n=1 Tax=Sistotremastrum suecicum HHB10207 ss-3 TaxID=1314776 RepID=A0A166IRD1_9AGAM|nr:hypothetical protein SISSUDRAFT_1057005 [Sistotremastrum suecicum HHB10207 ss-3]
MPSQSPFALYASNFLNKSLVAPSDSSDNESHPPLFFSFTDAGSSRDRVEQLDPDELDDEYDTRGRPVLRGDSGHYQGPSRSSAHVDDDDPYLQLDDEDEERPTSSSHLLSISLTETEPDIPFAPPPRSPSPPRRHSPSPSPSSSPSESTESPPDSPHSISIQSPLPQSPPPTRNGLTESLLPRDGVKRSVFSLPDSRRIPYHKYNDFAWIALWCTSLICCAIAFIVVLAVTYVPSESPGSIPYSTLLHAVPLFTIISFISAALSYMHLILLRFAVRPVLMATAILIPFTMAASAIWAFSGSFIWDGRESTWGETIGLRIYSLVPLILAILTARSIHNLRHSFTQTVRVTEISVRLLLSHSPLLMLSAAVLFVAFIVSLPFLGLIFRLMLVGQFSKDGREGSLHWHVAGYANWLIFLTTTVWVWSWFIARGVLRVTCSGVIAAWYFRSRDYPDPAQTTQLALTRATGPSLGTICLSSLLLTICQSMNYLLRFIRYITTLPFMPAFLHPINIPISILQSWIDSLSIYALIYAGLTGDPFLNSARRSRAITSIKRPGVVRRHYTLLNTLLKLSALSSALVASLVAYLFTAHALGRPYHAPIAAFLAGLLTCLIAWFSFGIVIDTADTLYMCYCLNRGNGAYTTHSKEILYAFEGQRPTGGDRV